MRIKLTCILALMAIILCVPMAAGAATYDLKTDWSNASNPNEVWSFWQGSYLLPHVANWVSKTGQDAWAFTESGTGHVPVWLKSVYDNLIGATWIDFGDVAFHPSTGSSYDYGEGYVKWTSPISGIVTISGNVFTGEYDFSPYRAVDWVLSLKGSPLDSGWVDYSGSYNGEAFTTPDLSYNVNAGDTIIFTGQTRSGSTNPFLVGVNLTIDIKPSQMVPEPTTMLLLGLGLIGLAGVRGRMNK